MKKILILVPHMDDEVLSFGGLILKSLEKGDKVKVVCFTCGGPCSNVHKVVRNDEYHEVMTFLGVTDFEVYKGGFDMDGRLDQIPNCELTNVIDTYIREYEPDEVYCGSQSEHSDHQALVTAFKGSARLKAGFMPKLFALGTYQFSDQLYQSPDGGKIFNPLTEDVFKKKLEAFSKYKSQLRPSPSPLGLDGLITFSKYLGLMCGAEYAELYYQLRYIRS